MRIAYLTSQYPAASHTFIRREVAALRRQGIDICTFSVRRPAENETVAPEDRSEFAQTGYILPAKPLALLRAHAGAVLVNPSAYLRTLALAMRHRPPGIKALLWALFHFVEAIVLAKLLKQAGASRLHNHFANAGANVGLLAAQFSGLPWSLTLHGISETDYPAGLLLPEKVRLAQFVTCVSWFGRAQAMRITPSSEWHKFIIARCGVDAETMPEPESIAKVSGRILSVGRLSAEKGQEGLIEAFAALRDSGSQATLRFVGDGPERDRLSAKVAALGLQDVVSFAGRKSERETLKEIAAAELFVLPSFMEGLPVVLMEAMALGVPVISSQVAGIPELVVHDQTGLLFAPSDWAGLAAEMTRLLNDDELAARLAQAAYCRVTAEFAVDTAIAPLLARFGSPEKQPLVQEQPSCV
jgi:glycosyltransferase involved in cell wall biosynthesis